MKLVYYPNKVLDGTCQPLELKTELDRERIKPKISRMFRLMKEHDGVGLSACQIGWPVRVFCMNTKDVKETFINPKIIADTPDLVERIEGCLSFPGLWLKIERPVGVLLEYENLAGEKITKGFSDLEARIIYHEMDHLDGKVFTNAR